MKRVDYPTGFYVMEVSPMLEYSWTPGKYYNYIYLFSEGTYYISITTGQLDEDVTVDRLCISHPIPVVDCLFGFPGEITILTDDVLN